LQRRRGCIDGAVAVWEEAAGEQQVYACVELAKHYEHRLHDCRQAAQLTQQAIDLVTGADMPGYERRRWLAELSHRLNRLERKLARGDMRAGR
jgi:hypothetical protein